MGGGIAGRLLAAGFGFPDEEGGVRPPVPSRRRPLVREKPIFSRLVSFDYPEVIEEGMVFALETFWPSRGGWSAARIEELLVVTADAAR
jgi:Xaa-Pro aminopeptidase